MLVNLFYKESKSTKTNHLKPFLGEGGGGGWARVSDFYAPPQKVAGYYVIPSELLSVCPSVRPSVSG